MFLKNSQLLEILNEGMIRCLGFALEYSRSALAGVAQWIECRPANQRVASSIPRQRTCLGCGPGPPWRGVWGGGGGGGGGSARGNHTIDASLSLFLHPFPSL